MQKKLLVLDIDGTLTNSKKEITKKTKEKLFAIQEMGHIVMLASGRPTPGMTRYAKELRLAEYEGYLLSYNGARVLNCKTGKVIYDRTLPREVIPKLYKFAKKHHCGIISYEKDTVLSGNGLDEYIELEARINGIPIREIDNFPDYIDFPVNKCLMTAKPQDAEVYVELLQKEFGNTLSIYRSEPFFIEIMPYNIDKAASLDRTLPLLNLTRKNTICCGDGYNDISMIEYANIGVAMKNAREEVKAIADFITDSNDEDGLVKVIDKFIL